MPTTTIPQSARPAAARPRGLTCNADALQTLSCLLRTVDQLNSAEDLGTGLERVAEQLRPSIPFDTFAVLLLDPLGQELRFHFAVGVASEVLAHWRFGMGQGIVGRVAQSGEAIVAQDVEAEEGYLCAVPEVRAEAAFPLVAKGRTVGVLDIGSFAADFFTTEDQRFLSLVAGHLATAIESHQLYGNLRRQTRILSALHEASRDLTSILDRGALLERIAELVRRQIDYRHFSVLEWNARSQRLETIYSSSASGCIHREHGLALGQGLCGTAAALRQTIRVGNVQLDPRYEACHDDQTRSELVVPLLFKERLAGVLDLESDQYNAFTADHEQFLSTLASYVGIALENASLYERLREDERKLAADLDTARRIQRYLLPKKTPWVPGLQIAVAYSPARHLGGDLYDVLSYGEDRTAVFVGDVAGKGAAAALYGSLAIGMLRGYAGETCDSPAGVLRYLNNELNQLAVERRFLALTVALFDSSTRKLQVANAGLPYPWLLRGDEIREIEASGVPVGAFDKARHEEVEIDLEVGDVVVLATDGFEEMRRSDGEVFGEESMRRVLQRYAGESARSIADGLLDASARFLGELGEPTDDRTVVVLKVVDADPAVCSAARHRAAEQRTIASGDAVE